MRERKRSKAPAPAKTSRSKYEPKPGSGTRIARVLEGGMGVGLAYKRHGSPHSVLVVFLSSS